MEKKNYGFGIAEIVFKTTNSLYHVTVSQVS